MNNNSYRRPLKIVLISLFSVVMLVVITTSIISAIYEKALIRYLKGYLGEHLLTELTMDDVRFRFLKGFPNITIEISDVVLKSGANFSRNDFEGTFSDTLLQAKSMYLQFDLLKLAGKDYDLKKIEVSDGNLNVLYDYKGRNNLSIWKSAESTGKSYSVNLKNIELNNTNFRVILLDEQFALQALAQNLEFRGKMSANMLSGETNGKIKVRSLNSNQNALLNNASLELGLQLVYSSKHLRIPKANVKLNRAVAHVVCDYKGGRDKYIELTVDMPEFGLDELMSLIPYDTRFSTGDYSFSGNGKLHFTISGIPGNTNQLLIKSDFELNQGTARNTKTRTQIDNLTLKGIVSGTNARDFMLQIDTLNADIGKGFVQGSFLMNNLKNPRFRSNVHSMVDLKTLIEFINLDSLEMSGRVYADFRMAGNFNGVKGDSAVRMLDYLQSGSFRFENAALAIKDAPFEFSRINGKAKWNQALILDSLNLIFNESTLMVSGTVQNLTGYLLKQNYLKSDLQISTDIISINRYLRKSDNSSAKHYEIFPDRILLNAIIKSDHFVAGKFEATDVTIQLQAKKDSILMRQFAFRFPDGHITGNATISLDRQQKLTVRCTAQPQKINIQQLFYAFDNFAQHFILDKNIRGQLGGSISFVSAWDSALILMPKTITARGDFEITNGELFEFEPMMKLSKYIDLEELRHIKFKTLKNSIDISDRSVLIPEMAIQSSAFNIRVSGQHSFDNLFDYRLRVLLSEVLFNKARKKKKEIDEFLVEESAADHTTIPLIIAGTPDNFDVKFDRRKAFNLSTRNKTNTSMETKLKPENNNIRVEWEEPAKTEKKETTTKSNPSDIVIEWDE